MSEAVYGAAPGGDFGPLKSPFPYAGGKGPVAQVVWDYFGQPVNYVEPFAGSLAVLLQRPEPGVTETVNDKSGLITNVWRAIQAEPSTVAKHCRWPANELDLTARHLALVKRSPTLTDRLIADPDYYDARLAGWWLWGQSLWIGSGWCSGDGAWSVGENGEVLKQGGGVSRKMPGLTPNAATGINRAEYVGVNRQMPGLTPNAATGINRAEFDTAAGVNRQLPSFAPGFRGVTRAEYPTQDALESYLVRLSARLSRVRVACGDWQRVCSPTVTHQHGLTAVFLDPPYPDTMTTFYEKGATDCWHEAQAWAIEAGKRPDMRIALCGMNFTMPDGWIPYRWKRVGGFGVQGQGVGRENAARELIWFSPACRRVEDLPLFAAAGAS